MDYEELLKTGPYDMEADKKSACYGELLSALTDHHRSRNPYYDRICSLLGDRSGTWRREEDILMIPVSLFKSRELLSVERNEVFKSVTSSGTSGQQTSKILLDQRTADWQQRTLERIVSSFIGEKRLPMLIIDSPQVLRNRNLFSARGAGILGFSIFGTKRRYALKENMEPDFEAIRQFARETAGEPTLIFGFTYIIWKYFCQPLIQAGKTIPLEKGFLIHGGGWKKLQKEAVSEEEFCSRLFDVCKISNVRNYYGMAEQTGCIYMECEYGHLHVSNYSDVLIRSMDDFSCCKNGTEGAVQVLAPMAWSYPGHSILTEDKGVILGVDDCRCGRKGKYFKITGRLPRAEIRGCSDTYEDKKEEKLVISGEREGFLLLAGSKELSEAPMDFFSEEILAYLDALSTQIRKLPRGEVNDEFKALGFWLRRSNLQGFLERGNYREAGQRMGLGISLHIAPANVPLLFAYSCAIGLLAGNNCRVRLSGRRTAECGRLCKMMDDLLRTEEFSGMRNRISLFTCSHEDKKTMERFCLECDVRVIWGGDDAIQEIRRIPIRPDAVELTFPDRTSITVLGAGAVLALSPEELGQLADRFYNDTYSMDQNACSCPKIVYWCEENRKTGEQAAERFWNALAKTAERYSLSEIKASRKYGQLWETAGAGASWIRRWGNRLYVITVETPRQEMPWDELRFGSFAEYHMKHAEEWTLGISRKTQTVTYFGVKERDLKTAVLEKHLRGVLRIVPVGQALWMEPVWDGKDMMAVLSRTI